MIVNRVNITRYSEKNLDFNNKMNVLINEIFQAERIGEIGYQMSTNENFKEIRYKNIFDDHKFIINPESNKFPPDYDESEDEELGPVEKKIVAYLNSFSMTIIVITGALGCGKTATLEFVRKYLKKKNKEKCKKIKIEKIMPLPFIIYINFNEGYSGDNFYELIEEFEIDLFVKLKRVMGIIYSNYSVMDAFLEHVSNINILGWEAHFDNFRSEYILRENSNWSSLSDIQKSDTLFNWIENLDRSYSQKINLLARLANFVKNYLIIESGCFVFAFDNIDKLPDELQIDFLSIIFTLTEISRVKTIVPMRLTSFGWVRVNEAYDFAHYELAGHPPINIIIKRIEHYLDNKDKGNYNKLRKDIPNHYLKILDEKMHYIKNLLLDKNNNRFKSAFEAFSGVSIRRGLHLAKRMFVNNATDFKHFKPYSNELIRSLIISDHEEPKMYYDDRRITNIFISQSTNSHSLINIRILQILYYFRKKRIKLKMDKLLYHLKHIREWDKNVLLRSINNLIFVSKRLAYIDGRSQYKNYFEMESSSNDIINITWSGMKYLDTLLYDLVYLQECFSIIDWQFKASYVLESERLKKFISDPLLQKYLSDKMINHASYMPGHIDYSLLLERFAFVRFGLSIFLYVDVQEFINYKKSGIEEENIIINDLIFVDVICKVSRSVLYIVLRQIHDYKIPFNIASDELIKWLDLLYIANKVYQEIQKTENPSLNETIEEYESNLNLSV